MYTIWIYTSKFHQTRKIWPPRLLQLQHPQAHSISAERLVWWCKMVMIQLNSLEEHLMDSRWLIPDLVTVLLTPPFALSIISEAACGGVVTARKSGWASWRAPKHLIHSEWLQLHRVLGPALRSPVVHGGPIQELCQGEGNIPFLSPYSKKVHTMQKK